MKISNIWDIHLHAVPGVDDGSDSLDTSMKMLDREYREGVRNMIVTPHFRHGMFETPRDRVEEQYLLLKKAAAEKFPDLNLYLGCEFHSNFDITETIDSDARYRMNGTRYVLMEFSPGAHRRDIVTHCREVSTSGFYPVIAHAERCDAIRDHTDLIDDLQDMGCSLQINADSIIGDFGWGIKRFCARLLKDERIDFIGSDAHNVRSRVSHMEECVRFLTRKCSSGYAGALLVGNPECMMRGEHL